MVHGARFIGYRWSSTTRGVLGRAASFLQGPVRQHTSCAAWVSERGGGYASAAVYTRNTAALTAGRDGPIAQDRAGPTQPAGLQLLPHTHKATGSARQLRRWQYRYDQHWRKSGGMLFAACEPPADGAAAAVESVRAALATHGLGYLTCGTMPGATPCAGMCVNECVCVRACVCVCVHVRMRVPACVCVCECG